ncbi:MAG: hypothetical protein OXN86_06695 [Chloroflexota bacterium]|nr:hypothetical protein [Chloroflexota bacterium]
MFDFEELTDEVRSAMLQEFEAEENGGEPYRSTLLTEEGIEAFPVAMRKAIASGNEEALKDELSQPEYWERFNFESDARRLAVTEFNTWYVRGLSRRLLDEGLETCEIYRAADAQGPSSGECPLYEGALLSLQEVYDGHRARYWPWPGDPDALSVPAHPNCLYTIRRCQDSN